MLRGIRVAGVVLLLGIAYAGGWIVAKTGMGRGVEPASLTDLERAFAERMQDVTLVGFFTIEGREDEAQRHPERYEIASVTRTTSKSIRSKASASATVPDGPSVSGLPFT